MTTSPLYGKVALISNPESGGGAGRAKLREFLGILHGHNIKVEPMVTQNPGHATELGKKVKEGDYDCLLVLGGDGTISEVAKGFYGSQLPIASIPCGSGNDMAGSLGIPRKLEEAFQVLLQADIIKLDIFKDKDDIYIETIGCGFVAEVVASVARLSRIVHGPAAYFAAVIETMSRFKASSYKIIIDGVEWDGDASLVIINNSFRVGGGMKLTPDAVLDDGLLDIGIVTTTSKLQLMTLLPKVYSGAHVNSPHVKIMRGKKISVTSDRELIKTADGEIVGTLPIDIEVIPGAMNFFKAKN